MDIMINWLIVLIEMITLAYFYKGFLNTKRRKNISWPLAVIVYGAAGFAIIGLGKLQVPIILSCGAGATAFIAAEIIYQGGHQNKLFGALIFTVIEFGAEAIIWCVLTLAKGLMDAYYVQLPLENYILGALLSKGLAIVIVVCFTRWKGRHSDDIDMKKPIYWLLPLTTVILMYMLIDLTFTMDIRTIKIRIALVCIFLIALNFLVTYLWYQQMQSDYLNRELILKDMVMESRIQYYEAIEQQNERVKRMRHEVKKHTKIFIELLNNQEIEKAKLFIIDYIDDLDKQSKVYAKDTVLNSILTMAYEQAEGVCMLETDILFNHPVVIQPQHFVTVLGNCLENAIEAAAKAEQAEKIVYLEMRASKGSVLIRITNPVKEDVDIDEDEIVIETSKSDKNKHGFGLKNVRDVVALYDGHISLSCENKVFQTDIRLNNWSEPSRA